MKYVHVIGGAAVHEVIVRDPAIPIHDLRAYVGSPLISQLISGKLASGKTKDRKGIDVHITIPNLVSHSLFLGSHGTSDRGRPIIIGERIGDRDPHPYRGRLKETREIPDPDLLIIHDMDAVHPERSEWIASLNALRADSWAIIRSADPCWMVDAGKGGAKQRILIMDAGELRSLGAPISKGRSWDASFTELIMYFRGDGRAMLTHATHVLILFGAEAVVHISTGENEPSFLAWFDASGQEWTATPGVALGTSEVFIARLTIELLRAQLPRQKHDKAPVKWVDDVRTVEQRLPFAAIQGLRSVQRGRRIGWRERSDELSLPAEVFTLDAMEDTPLAGMDITTLPDHASLLHLAMHGSEAAVDAWTMHYVRTGVVGMLGAAPLVKFGKVLTADRGEIEQYRKLEQDVLSYLRAPGKIPLSIGVFGPPGSGKTFGVKQVAKALGDRVEQMSFNFGPYTKREQFVSDLHRIRDTALLGRTPFVLFDEFDSSVEGEAYGWFRHFLEPVNEGVFLDAGFNHPVGPAVLLFTGGTCNSYADFVAKCNGGEPLDKARAEWARERKMPDMASRLVKHIDVKGISAQPGEPAGPHRVRRAIILRSMLVYKCGAQEKDGGMKKEHLPVDLNVLSALLHLPAFNNGTRSLEKLIVACDLSHTGRLDKGALPMPDELNNFLDPVQFNALMKADDSFQEVVEELAQLIHADWLKNKAPQEA
ncbi:MAG: AAA family ATPase, partial [Flavobacteriales bacterium]